MKQEVQVVMLPTEDKSPLFIGKRDKKLHYFFKGQEPNNAIHQHLYITVDQKIEPIKEGDWVYWADPEGITSDINQVVSVNEEMIFMSHPEHSETEASPNECRKIIATTDKKLRHTKITPDQNHVYTKGVPQVSQSFIKEYCDKGGIDKVMVEYDQALVGIGAFPEYTQGLKLNSDNTINISLIEEKMYSREEVEDLLWDALTSSGPGAFNMGWTNEAAKEWIEENL